MTTRTGEPSYPPYPRLISLLIAALPLCFLFPASAQSLPGVPFTNLYQRASVQFAAVDFFKPLAPQVEDVTYKLAPLLLQEVSQGKAETKSLDQDRFGRLALSSTGGLSVDTAQPTLYVMQDTVQLKGRLCPRLSYLWFYSVEPAPHAEGPLPLQGVRLTLNSAGQPVVWEVLAEHSGAELLFVAQSLESAAQAQSGKPLPGRRYSIERGTNEAPRTVVARVIDDGPMPMGPLVYLSARSRSVSTLLCRCMPAQAKQVRTTRTYELKPLPPGDELLTRARLQTQLQTAFWPGDSPSPSRLDQCLRLPDNF